MGLRARLAAVSACITLAGVVGCADPAAVEPGAQGDPQAALAAIIMQIYGTREQREAGQEQAWLSAQSAIAACAATKGVVYAVTPYQPTSVGIPPVPGDLLGFAPKRQDFGVARRIEMLAKRGEPTNPGLAAVGKAGEEKWFTALDACQGAARPSERLTVPDGQERLDSLFVDMLAAAQQRVAPDLKSQYATCIRAAGIDADDLSEAYIKVEQAFPPVSGAQKSDPTTLPAWAPAVAFERKVAATDWKCREQRVGAVVDATAGDVAAFADANAATLKAVSDGWAAMPTAVQQLRSTVKVTPVD